MGFFILGIVTMQILKNIPNIEELALPLATSANVIELLIEPFGTLDSAQQFWKDYPCILICLNKQDTIPTVLTSLSDELGHFVELAESSPEIVEFISEGYQLSLTIMNDEGNGLYLVKPVDLTIRRPVDEATSRQMESDE